MKLFQLFFAMALIAAAINGDEGKEKSKVSIEIRSPRPGEHVVGADMWLDLSIHGVSVPQDAVGIIFMDGNKAGRLTAATARLDVDGVGDMRHGRHEIRVILVRPNADGSEGNEEELGVEETTHFIKAPENRKVNIWEDEYDDDLLEAIEKECGEIGKSKVRVDWAGPSDPPPSGFRIALGLPVMSAKFSAGSSVDDDAAKGLDISQYFEEIDDLPLFTHFFPSLRDSINASEPFSYRVYLGYDYGDPLYDDVENRRRISEKISAIVRPHRVSLKWIGYEGYEGKVFHIYNNLFEQAYIDGAHYFYMVNDDLRLVTHGWAKKYVDALLSSPIHPNFGVAGPLDLRDVHKTHMTFGFHPRLHYEIFNAFYPAAFPNWWADNWISAVFGKSATFWLNDVHIHNTQCAGQRYSGFWQGHELYREELQAGRRQVLKYCRCVKTGRRFRFGACLDTE